MDDLASQKMAIGVQDKLAEYDGVPFERTELSLFAWHVLNDLTRLRKQVEELEGQDYERRLRDLDQVYMDTASELQDTVDDHNRLKGREGDLLAREMEYKQMIKDVKEERDRLKDVVKKLTAERDYWKGMDSSHEEIESLKSRLSAMEDRNAS